MQRIVSEAVYKNCDEVAYINRSVIALLKVDKASVIINENSPNLFRIRRTKPSGTRTVCCGMCSSKWR
jgi:hypothetical protein